MDQRHGVDRGALQRVPQHVGLDGGTERHVEPDAFLAARADEVGEPLAEGSVDEREGAASDAVADRQFHEPGRRGGPDQHRAGGAGERLQSRRHSAQQLLHRARAVPDHRLRHGGQHFGVDVGGPGEEELPEGRRDWSGDGGRRAHAVARASWSTRPPTTTSLVFTRRTPSSPHSFTICSATSRSMGFIASVTAKSRVWGRCRSRPSIA